jgi:hypothetical protein
MHKCDKKRILWLCLFTTLDSQRRWPNHPQQPKRVVCPPDTQIKNTPNNYLILALLSQSFKWHNILAKEKEEKFNRYINIDSLITVLKILFLFLKSKIYFLSKLLINNSKLIEIWITLIIKKNKK